MKYFILLITLLTNSQIGTSQDCLDKVASQAVQIDSLKRNIALYQDTNKAITSDYQDKLKIICDSMKSLSAYIAKLNEIANQKEKLDIQIQMKSDSIRLFKSQLTEFDKIIYSQRIAHDSIAKTQYEKGKYDVLHAVIEEYSSGIFDELIAVSSFETIKRDSKFLNNKNEISKRLNDLFIYFEAKKQLANSNDIKIVKDLLPKLNMIREKSKLVAELKTALENYESLSYGLKKALENIQKLDEKEQVSGMGKEIKDKKRDKIFAYIGNFIFDYDFNLIDYPFLSNILMGALKRKRENPDSDISDLISKL